MSFFNKKAYTLIEVLIAIVIFSSIITIATMALNQGLKQYHGILDKGINFWDNARFLWINKSLSSTVDYYVYSRGDGWFPYFRGTQEVISYITLAPLTGDKPVVAWIINERDDNGNRSLVYYELPVYTKDMKDIEKEYIFQDFKKGNSVTILNDVENVDITFYGYDMQNKKYSWVKDFDGGKRKVLPQVVRIDYRKVGESGKKTIAFSVYTNSLIKTLYNDTSIYK